MDMTQLSEEPGWVGGFTRQQAAGAVFANGARVKKDKFREGDDHYLLSPVLRTVLPTRTEGVGKWS